MLRLIGFTYLVSSVAAITYSLWAADSVIKRNQSTGIGSAGTPVVSYDDGEFQWGLRQLYEREGNESYFQWILKAANNIVFDNGTVHGSYSVSDYSQDPVRTGPTFLYLYEKTGSDKWKIAADIFRGQLDGQPRTAEGQFWHKLRYFNQGWLDGIYMGEVFYAQYTQMFQPDNETAWDDITLQFNLMFKNTVQLPNDTNYRGLLYHGYDYSGTQVWASPDRGHSPEVWDRALGWYMMALVDVLDILPTSHPGHSSLREILRTLAPNIRNAADPMTGVWWLVMTQPGRDLNYFESSGSAMFVYALLKGVRLGYIEDDDGSIVGAAKKAYSYMTNNWVVANKTLGTMDWFNTVQVGSLGSNGTFEYYVSVPTDVNDLKGVAAFLLASLEYEKL